MLDNFIYENHLGQRFEGSKNNTYLNYNDLRDYSWSYDTINSRISRFYRPISDRKIPLWVHCNYKAEANAVKNRLYEVAEADVEAKKPGKVYIGDWYTTGYITSSAKSSYLIHDNMCRIDLVLTSDDPAWYKETTYAYPIESGGVITSDGKDYNYDYVYDYAEKLNGRTILCHSVCSNAFRMVIYGAVNNPTVVIGGHIYSVNYTINEGEKLVIDSVSKTITLIKQYGDNINLFYTRNRNSYIFEPIPPGENSITWQGVFAFDLTIIEKRSEPRWT